VTSPDRFAALLDQIDPNRYDVDEIVRKLNEYDELDAAEQDEHDDVGGSYAYAGADDAIHPLTELCGEAHNSFFIVRDLDGSLCFVFETTPATERWDVGPLYQEHVLPGLESLAELIEAGDAALPMASEDLRELINGLPDDPPGQVRSF